MSHKQATSRTLRLAQLLAWVCGFLLWSPPPSVAAATAKAIRPAFETYFASLGFGAIRLERGPENHLLVSAQLAGKTRQLIVDTGCSMTTLDKSLAKKFKTPRELGIQLEDATLGPLTEPNIVLIEELRLGSARFPNQPAWSLSLAPATEAGILGCDFLLRHSGWVDCTDGRLYVRTAKLNPEAQQSLERYLHRAGHAEVTLQASPGLVLTCDAEINGESLRLMVDTGAMFTVLDTRAAQRCHLRWRASGQRIAGIGRIGSTSLLAAPPKSFTLAGHELSVKGLNIGNADMARWGIGGKPTPAGTIEGVLGADFLAVSGGLIDFAGRKLWFLPVPPKEKPAKVEAAHP